VYEVQHALDKAEEALRSALKIRERTLAPDDPRIAASLNRLAQVLTLQDRLDEAEDLLRRALKIHGLLN
jgi:tetratricopeptide (TPR) repeat protein